MKSCFSALDTKTPTEKTLHNGFAEFCRGHASISQNVDQNRFFTTCIQVSAIFFMPHAHLVVGISLLLFELVLSFHFTSPFSHLLSVILATGPSQFRFSLVIVFICIQCSWRGWNLNIYVYWVYICVLLGFFKMNQIPLGFVFLSTSIPLKFWRNPKAD